MSLSGMEPLVAKAAASGSIKALGWGGRSLKRRFDTKKLLKRLTPPVPDDEITPLLAQLGPEDAERFLDFLGGREFGQIAFAIATHRMIKACGKDADTRLDELRRQLSLLMHLKLPTKEPWVTKLSDYVFDLVDQAVTTTISDAVEDNDHIPISTRATITKAAASVAAATVRNADVLAGIQTLENVAKFEREYRQQVMNLHGTMRLPHAGTSRQVPYERLFVQPTVSAPGQGRSDEDPSAELPSVLDLCVRTVLLGNPGGGKSTSSLKLTFDVASGRLPDLATTPFLIVLREYAEQLELNRTSIIQYIEALCETPYGIAPPEGVVEYLLNNGRAIVIFDGLDELLNTSDRREVAQIVEGFAYRYPMTQILVTSRKVGYDEARLDDDLFSVVELQEFSREQVEAYVRKWFSLDDSIAAERRSQLAGAFLQESEFVQDLRVNPLMLSLMCGIYASENYIPRNRPDVYEKCALLLFERWDKQRGINPKMSFDAHVQAAMRSLALWLYPRQESQQGLNRDQLIAYMKSYLLQKRFDKEEDAEQAATEFIDFCKGRAWVLTDVGAELYGFTHRTFLEYFAASQLVRLHPSAEALLTELWPRIVKSEWDVVAQLSLQILGRTVEDGADDFLGRLVEEAIGFRPSDDSRRNAIAFACRALAFIVPRPDVLRAIVAAAVDTHCEDVPRLTLDTSRGTALAAELLFVGAENLPMVSRYLRDAVVARLEVDEMDERAIGLAAYLTAYGARSTKRMQNAAFWGSQAAGIRASVAEYLPKQAGRHYWVAVMLAEENAMPIREVIGCYGVRALYDFHIAGDVLEAPLAYRIIEEALRGNGRHRFRSAVMTELFDVLLETPAPWIGNDRHYDNISYVVEMFSSRRHAEPSGGDLVRSVAALLAMPIVELRTGSNPHSVGERQYGRGVLLEAFGIGGGRGRRGGSGGGAFSASGGRVNPAAQDQIDVWLRGEVNYVARRGSGRLTASPKLGS